MSGVNDLAKEWLGGRSLEDAESSGDLQLEGAAGCASDLRETARTAWHPVSNPPTEADGDRNHCVFVWYGGDDFGLQDVQDVRNHAPDGAKWARVSDVLLMPPEGEGE